MFYKNARIFTSDFHFHHGAFQVENGRFGAILPENVPEDAIDLQGATVIPGLIDVHIHGAGGADFSSGTYEDLTKMAKYLASAGITSFCPTSMTLPYEQLEKAFANGRQLRDEAPKGCARMAGAHMEGPYFSFKKKGAQNPAYLKDPDFPGFEALYKGCDGAIAIADVAPELPGAEEFIRKAKDLCTVSIAHTDASYDHAKAAYEAGATHLTHTYNAMPGIHHRDPGVIPAASENPNVRAELICDGLHVHPASIRLAFSLFGPERMIIVSDALQCCGLPDGDYESGGLKIHLEGGIARLMDGTIAGAATNQFAAMQRAISYGIAPETAIRAATYNPACAIGKDGDIGSIATGKYADFVVCDDSFQLKAVYIGGEVV